jgi:hypothetical protein
MGKKKINICSQKLVEVIERGNVALVQSINQIHDTNLQIEKNMFEHKKRCYKSNCNISNSKTQKSTKINKAWSVQSHGSQK